MPLLLAQGALPRIASRWHNKTYFIWEKSKNAAPSRRRNIGISIHYRIYHTPRCNVLSKLSLLQHHSSRQLGHSMSKQPMFKNVNKFVSEFAYILTNE